jgi:tRNA(fMet)-specific endonuclease VapC
MAIKIALDVNRYSDICRGDEYAKSVVGEADSVALPLTVLGELRAGFRFGRQGAKNERILGRFLNSERVTVLLPDVDTTYIYAMIYADLRHKGTPIPDNDMWIAALVMQHNYALFSRDKHFEYTSVHRV